MMSLDLSHPAAPPPPAAGPARLPTGVEGLDDVLGGGLAPSRLHRLEGVPVRFFEAEGRVRKALSVIKNRGGAHEDTIRELRIDRRGARVGGPPTGFHGIMTGTLSYAGSRRPLEERSAADA